MDEETSRKTTMLNGERPLIFWEMISFFTVLVVVKVPSWDTFVLRDFATTMMLAGGTDDPEGETTEIK